MKARPRIVRRSGSFYSELSNTHEGDLVEAELKLLLFILDVYTIFVQNEEITRLAQNNKHN